MIVYLAQKVLPVAGPVLAGGAVAVAGSRVVACGLRQQVLEAFPRAARRDLGQVALLPGLVNAHTHLELSWMGEDPPAGSEWVEWVRALVARREREDPARACAAAARELERMLVRGTVAVGDVGNHGWTASVLAAADVHGVVFLETYGFLAARARTIHDAAIARLDDVSGRAEVRAASARLRVVLTPHAPHTTSPELLRLLGERAHAAREPISIHLAESAAECAFVREAAGPFAQFLRERGMAEPGWRGTGRSPVAHVASLGVLGPRALAVHCVRLEDADVGLLRVSGATVVTCPRSNRKLGVGVAPVPRLLAAGVSVALGTDSLASAPDLDMFAEMAALRAEHPALAAADVLRAATLAGAAALGLDDRLGSIEAGKLARLVVVPLAHDEDDPQDAVTRNPPRAWPLEAAPWQAG